MYNAETSDIVVSVRRHPQDWATANYRLRDIRRLHWSSMSGGVGKKTSHPTIFGYVWCDKKLSGSVAHSCQHGPPPHDILICVPKVANKIIWPLLKKHMLNSENKYYSGDLLSNIIAPALRDKLLKHDP